MLSFDTYQTRLVEAFDALSFPDTPSELYEPVHYTLSLGGKRLRPLLVLASCDLFRGEINDAIHPAIGIELFHNFTLLHDDLMDQAPLRRGKETVYKKWNPNIAILAGDTMFALANKEMLITRPDVIGEVLSLFNTTAVEVCEGQQYDMNFETNPNVSIEEYVEMIRLKTAVLLAASLKTGAIIAGASTLQCNSIYQFGINIGLAFQLMDDLLDVYGSEDKFGKVPGGDILAAKKTYLYLKSLDVLPINESHELTSIYKNKEITGSYKIESVMEYFNRAEVYELTRKAIDQYWVKAIASLQSVSIEEDRKQPLLEYCSKLMNREQ